MGQAKASTNSASAPTQSLRNLVTPFTEEALVNAWKSFAEKLDKRVYLKNTLLNCLPKLTADFILEVKVLNPGQQETLFNAAVEILPYLRQQLQNSKIQMRVTVDESNEKHLAYTSTEKYNHLLAINPALGKLQSEFNLRTD